jgi:hypothetical protein
MLEDKLDNIPSLTIDILHTNLVLLSKIKPGDKLIYYNNLFNIDRSYLQFAKRWYYSECRIKTINYINIIIDQIFMAIDLIIIDDAYITLSSETRDTTLQRFTIELKNSINGLINLKTTYIDDHSITSSIDVIIENINNKITTLNNLLKIVNQHN